MPRSALEVTDELRQLLQTAGVPAPYLFVGHSLGGIYAQRYAQRFPGEVAGMLLLEPPHEDFLIHTPKLKKRYLLQQGFAMLRTLVAYKRVFRGIFEHMFEEWPDAVREPLIQYHLRTLTKTISERKNLNGELYDDIRKGGKLPDAPLIVFSTLGNDPFMTPITSRSFLHENMDSFNRAKTAIYGALGTGERK
nr:alpha/beta hydrolase [Cohnella sp. REN36]